MFYRLLRRVFPSEDSSPGINLKLFFYFFYKTYKFHQRGNIIPEACR